MESAGTRNLEQNTLISELMQGFELAKQLRLHLGAESSVESREFLVQRILSSYDKALLILNWSGSGSSPVCQTPALQMAQNVPVSHSVAVSPVAVSPVAVSPVASLDGSPRSDGFDKGVSKDNQQCQNSGSKKRKMPKWTDQVRISSESGLEGPHCDGYNWRKYGQKDILGSRHPRSYYRCTYRNIKDCWATKQVQRSDEDPTIFEITYSGTHTCMHGSQSNPQPTTPETQETNQYNQNQSNELLQNFKNELRVDTQSFLFPATSEPTDFFVSPYEISNIGGVRHRESNLNDIVSASTYVTSSPNLDFNFSLNINEFDPNYPFGTSGFFS